VQLVTLRDGIARVEGESLAVLDVPWPDVGAVLEDQETLQGLAIAGVRDRRPVLGADVLAPVLRPGKVWGIGINYLKHGEETGNERPEVPRVFIKVTSAVIGTGASILIPPAAPDLVDYEGEVAVIIGRRATNVPEVSAWSHVAAVTACNDVSARDVQRGMGNVGLAKSFDTFCPLGASVVTPDEYDDPDDIGLRTLVNGELRQEARTSELFFGVPYVVSWLSRFTTLEPGDVITTGTPGRVGGQATDFLAPGDVVEVQVERVLPLVNPVAAT